jgi:hypothetical protein
MLFIFFILMQEFIFSSFINNRNKVDKNREKHSGKYKDVNTEKISFLHMRSS